MKSYTKMNSGTYNLVAKNYQAEHTEKIEWENELIKFLHYVGKDNTRVVDLGCGPGTESLWFSDHISKGAVYAVDIAEQMLSVFARIPKNLHTIVADMVSYQPNEKIDGIWARASIHHLTKAESAELFASIKKYLKPSGVLFMINKYGSTEEIEKKNKYAQVVKRYFQYFDENRVEHLANGNDFTVKEQYIVENDHKWLISVLVNNYYPETMHADSEVKLDQ